MDADGENQKRVSAAKFNASPVWSPDGQRIAFLAAEGPGPVEQNLDSTSRKAIRVVQADGSAPRDITTMVATARFGDIWAPAGRRLAFLCGADWSGSSVLAICTMNADGGGRDVVFRPYYFQNQVAGFLYMFWPALAWSPDSRRLAFHAVHEAEVQIQVMNADGTGRMVLTTQGYNWAPVWAPDGQRIAFNGTVKRPDRDASTEVFVINADGSGLKRLTDL